MESVKKPSPALNIILWIVQVLLSVTLVWAAYTKLFTPPDKLAAMWPWTANNMKLTKFTAFVDLSGALGLVLPMLLRIKPRLTVYAAYGIILLMVLASTFHILRGEEEDWCRMIALHNHRHSLLKECRWCIG